jgi:hypothetical protein
MGDLCRIKSILLCHWVALMLASVSLLIFYGAAMHALCASLCLVQFSSRVQSYFGFTIASFYLIGAFLRSPCVVHAI